MPPELYVILVAALPVVELRGAIPLGVALGLSPGEAFLLALLGNLLVAPVALFLLPWAVALLTRVPFLAKLWAALEARVRLKEEGQKGQARPKPPQGRFQTQGVGACRAQVHPPPPGQPVPQGQGAQGIGKGQEDEHHRR